MILPTAAKMATMRRMARKTPREILEVLCQDMPALWKEGRVNIYALAQQMHAAGSPVSQSTLDRLYRGKTEMFSEATVAMLSKFFQLPTAYIRGDLELDEEGLGVQITLSELRITLALRSLDPDKRRAVIELIRSLLPTDKMGRTPLLPGAIPLLPSHRKN